GWTSEAAEEVCAGRAIEKAEALNLLTRLVERSLAVRLASAEPARYRFLETIRQYALDRLLESREAAAARQKHLAYFLGLAEQAEPHLRGRDQVRWLDRLEAEHDNLRAALEWSQTAEAPA